MRAGAALIGLVVPGNRLAGACHDGPGRLEERLRLGAPPFGFGAVQNLVTVREARRGDLSSGLRRISESLGIR